MKKHLLKLSFLFALALIVASCQKEEIAPEEEGLSARSLGTAESLMDDASDEASLRTDPGYTAGDCPLITYANPQGTFPNTVTIDFGEGCEGLDGRFKSGQIIIEMIDEYYAEGSVRTISPVDFTVEGWSIEGTRTVTNMGFNEAGNMYWNVLVQDAQLHGPNDEMASWDAERTRTLMEGYDTPETCADNVYEITGGSSGINFRGESVTATITTPLVKRMGCRWVESGVREVQVDGMDGVRVMDFGDGTCDNKATVSLPNGNSIEITLRR